MHPPDRTSPPQSEAFSHPVRIPSQAHTPVIAIIFRFSLPNTFTWTTRPADVYRRHRMLLLCLHACSQVNFYVDILPNHTHDNKNVGLVNALDSNSHTTL